MPCWDPCNCSCLLFFPGLEPTLGLGACSPWAALSAGCGDSTLPALTSEAACSCSVWYNWILLWWVRKWISYKTNKLKEIVFNWIGSYNIVTRALETGFVSVCSVLCWQGEDRNIGKEFLSWSCYGFHFKKIRKKSLHTSAYITAYHRITEWFGFEGILKLIQCHHQYHFQTPVASSILGGVLTYFLESLVSEVDLRASLLTVTDAGLWHQLGCFQHYWSYECFQVYVQGEFSVGAAVLTQLSDEARVFLCEDTWDS